MNDADWIKPGASVVVYQEGHRSASTARRTTIARVAKLSFTVVGGDDRFKISTQRTNRRGGSWNTWNYRCVPADSDKAKDLLHGQRHQHLEYKAREACEAWCRDRTEANRLTAVEALTKLGEFGPRPTEETT